MTAQPRQLLRHLRRSDRRHFAAALAALLTAGLVATAGPRADRHGDPLPDGALQRLGTARLRHAGAGGLVAFLADGQTLLCVGPDGTVHFWEAATGRERRRVPTGHLGHAVALAPDEKTLAAAIGGGIGFWDLAGGKFLTGPLPTGAHTETRLACPPPDAPRPERGGGRGAVDGPRRPGAGHRPRGLVAPGRRAGAGRRAPGPPPPAGHGGRAAPRGPADRGPGQQRLRPA